MNLKADFTRFFQALWGLNPYPWQLRLLEWAADAKRGWPEAIALPTGSGKTAALDVALFLMALRPNEAHRRVVYVVNRRLVVDQAAERALMMARRLQEAMEYGGPLGEVARKLAQLGDGKPLRVVKLRGGLPLPRHPIPNPAAPTVVLSTLDQVGSRLLFRGYGLSSRAWPVEAGLLGVDALFLLDEAHLERPAFALLKALEARLEGVREVLGRPGLKVVALTATPETLKGLIEGDRVLQPQKEDMKALRTRWGVAKPLALRSAPKGNLASVLAEEAKRLREETNGPVAVFCNRVATARAVWDRLKKECPSKESLLLTGRVRPFDRDRLLAKDLQSRLDEGEVAFVVATQTLEVGADLDFSGLVTEHCPLTALFQRLGRLGRRGRVAWAPAVVVRPEEARGQPYPEEALAATWKWLEGLDEKTKNLGLGILCLRRTLKRKPPAEEAWGKKREEVLLPPEVLDLYGLTDPWVEALETEPLLHGIEGGQPEVYLAFRKDLELDLLKRWAPELEDLVPPPSVYELLPLPYHAARDFLEHREADAADLEGTGWEAPAGPSGGEGLWALRLGEEGMEVIRGALGLRPGDVLLVPAAMGGVDQYGWNPQAKEPVRDVAEARPPGGRPPKVLRLHKAVVQDALQPGSEPPFPLEALEGLGRVAVLLEEDPWEAERQAEALAKMLGLQGPQGSLERWIRGAVRSILQRLLPLVEDPWREAYRAALERLDRARIQTHPLYPGLVLRLSGANPFLAGTAPEGFKAHRERVWSVLDDFLRWLGLKEPLPNHLRVAAYQHDVGKLDPRFQTWLRLTAPPGLLPPERLAKSGTQMGPRAIEARRRQAGYPRGQRHELVGAASLRGPGEVLHLVATHHGHGRPIPRPPEEEDSEETRLEGLVLKTRHSLWRLSSGYAERFHSLAQKYTPWGLAYLEALLRLADQKASGEEGEDGED